VALRCRPSRIEPRAAKRQVANAAARAEAKAVIERWNEQLSASRSELVALDVADLEGTEDGFKIIIRRSKTDQEGHGVTIAIARGVTTCPVKAVKPADRTAAGGLTTRRTAGPLSK